MRSLLSLLRREPIWAILFGLVLAVLIGAIWLANRPPVEVGETTGGESGRFEVVLVDDFGPNDLILFRDAADGRCHLIFTHYEGGAGGAASIADVPCSVPTEQ